MNRIDSNRYDAVRVVRGIVTGVDAAHYSLCLSLIDIAGIRYVKYVSGTLFFNKKDVV